MLPTDGVVPSGVGMTTPAGLARGERAPDMVLASRDGTPTRYAHAGGRPGAAHVRRRGVRGRGLHALAEGLTAIGDEDLTMHVVGPPALAGHDLPFPLLQDADGVAPPPPTAPGAHRPPSCSTRTCESARRCRSQTAPASPPTSPSWSPSWSGTTGRAGDHHPGTTAGGAGRARPGAVRRAHHGVGAGGPQRHRRGVIDGRWTAAEQRSAQLKRRRDHIVQDPQRGRELAGGSHDRS